jgi:hypothetical protein
VLNIIRTKQHLMWTPLGLVLLLLASPVFGEIILADDTNAMAGWHSFADFSAVGGTKKIDGHIDFAVYAPGNFLLSFPDADASAATNYVYAYKIFNNPSPTSTDSITGFTVGLDGNENPVVNAFTGLGVAPSSNYFTGSSPTSSVWNFSSNRVKVDTNSSVLYFTCPYGPERDKASLTTTGPYAWTGTLPSPVPEPSTILGLAIFCGLLMAIRCKRR